MPNQNLIINNNSAKRIGTFNYREAKKDSLAKAIIRASNSNYQPRSLSTSTCSSTAAKVVIGTLLLASLSASASASASASQATGCIEVIKQGDSHKNVIRNNCDFNVGMSFKGKCGLIKKERQITIKAHHDVQLSKVKSHCLQSTKRFDVYVDDKNLASLNNKIKFPKEVTISDIDSNELLQKINHINKKQTNPIVRIIKLTKLFSNNINDKTIDLISNYLISLEMGSGVSMKDIYDVIKKSRVNDHDFFNSSDRVIEMLTEKKREINKLFVENLKSHYRDDCGKKGSRFGSTFWAENKCDVPIGFFMENKPSEEFIDADGKVYNKQYKTIWGHSWVYLHFHSEMREMSSLEGHFDRLPIHQGALPFPEILIHPIK